MKFKVGDKVIFIKPELEHYEWNPPINSIHEIISIKEDFNDSYPYVYDDPQQTFCFSENEIKLATSHIIRERLGIK